MVQLISGSSEPIVLENGARYLLWNAPFYAVLGVLLCTRYALQSLGQKVLPLFSSVIELVGKVIFVLVFIPKFQYNAVILCEPIIWFFMTAISGGGVPARALCVPEKITLSVIAVRCQLSRKGELFAFYGKHKESSPFRGSWMRTK